MDGGCHPVFVCYIGNLFQFQGATAGEDVGVNHRYTACFDQGLKALFEIDVLACANGDSGAVTKSDVLIGIHPRDHIFDPRQIVLFHSTGKADTVLYADMTEMVDGKGNLITNDLSYLSYIVFKIIKPLFGKVDACMGVCRSDNGITFLMTHHIGGDATALYVEDMGGIPLHLFKKAKWSIEGTGLIQQKSDAQVHLQKCKAHFHSLFEGKPHIVACMLAVDVGITVYPYFIAELAAKELVQGDAVRFACEVPKGDLNAGDATALTGMAAKLLDLVENAVYVTRVFPNDATFQHKSIGLGGGVAHLTVTADALVGINAQDGAALGRAVDIHKAHIGNSQIGRVGTVIHMFSLLL